MSDAPSLPDRSGDYEALPDEVVQRWSKFGRGDTVRFPNLLGLVVEDVRVDYCRMRMPFRPELMQGAGLVHGGAVASLLDAVLVPAVGAVLDKGVAYSTVDLHVQYIGALREEDAVAEGWVTRRGRSVVFCESEAWSAGSGRRIAKAILTYNIAAG